MLTTGFEELAPQLYLDSADTPLLVFSRPPMAFRWNGQGTKIGPHLALEVIAVPADMPERVRAQASEGELGAQEAVDLIEAEIQKLGESKHDASPSPN
jgi:hypothetical protein